MASLGCDLGVERGGASCAKGAALGSRLGAGQSPRRLYVGCFRGSRTRSAEEEDAREAATVVSSAIKKDSGWVVLEERVARRSVALSSRGAAPGAAMLPGKGRMSERKYHRFASGYWGLERVRKLSQASERRISRWVGWNRYEVDEGMNKIRRIRRWRCQTSPGRCLSAFL